MSIRNFCCTLLLCCLVPVANALESGSSITGTLVDKDDTAEYTISLSQGQSVVIHVGDPEQTLLAPRITLFDPSNTQLESIWNNGGARIFYRATSSGEYKAVISSASNYGGDYSLDVMVTGENAKAVIQSGVQASGTITPGSMDSYSYNAGANEYLSIHLGDINQSAYVPYVQLYGPDGQLLESVWNNGGARVSHKTTLAGQYTVAVFNSDLDTNVVAEGVYTLDFVSSGAATKYELVSGAQASGTITPGSMNSYSYTAGVDEHLSIHLGDINQSAYAPHVQLYGPDGQLLESVWNNGGARVSHKTTLAGQYTVAVFNSDLDTNVVAEGVYTLDFVSSGAATKYELVSGAQASGTITPGSMNSYSYIAGVDEHLSIHLGDINQSAYVPYVQLYGPDGQLLESVWNNGGARVSHKTTLAGQYTVAVFNSDLDTNVVAEGVYTLDFVSSGASAKSNIGSGSSAVGAITPGAMDSYAFNIVQAGDIHLNISDVSNNSYAPHITLYDPTGDVVYSNWHNSGLNTTLNLTELGRYTIVVFNSDIDTSVDVGKYSINLFGHGVRLAGGVVMGPAGSIKTKAPCTVSDCLCNCVGNPINLPQGFKAQFETDYKKGYLEFTRTYRSDSSWTNSDLGVNWRHNSLRKINFFIENTATRVELVDGSGSIVMFEKNGDQWQALDEDVRSRFEEVIDLDALIVQYRLTTPNESVEYFNQQGLLIRVEYRGGQSLDYTYDAQSRLLSITDEQNHSLTFSYDGQNRIAEVLSPDGKFSYEYDVQGNFSKLIKPDSKTRTYHYENTNFPNALTGITNERNIRVATWEYDDQGRPISSESAGGVNKTSVTYNDDLTVTSTNALGKQSTYHYETILGVRKVTRIEHHASGSTPASEELFEYSSDGLLEQFTDAEGNVTTYAYNDRGLETSRTEAYGTADERTISTTWVTEYRLPDVVTETGRTTDYEYDEFGRLTDLTVADTNTAQTRTTTYTYHSNTTNTHGDLVLGRLATIDGPRTDESDTVSYTYDSSFNITKVTNALGQEVRFNAFDASGRPLSTSDANGIETTFVYDSLGRLLTQTRLDRTTSYVYDAEGQLEKVTLPDGRTSSFSYDDAGRLVKTTSTTGESLELVLDNAGNRLNEIMRDKNSNITLQSKKEFDDLNRLISTIETINGTEAKNTFSYDANGNLKTVIDAKNNSATYFYDALQRVTEFTDAKFDNTSTVFNPLGQVSSVTAPNNAQTTFEYNAFGDVTKEISPDRGTTVYTYDDAGNMITRTDARGITASYSYDALNRLTSISYPTPSENVLYVYDNNPSGFIACSNGAGRLCRVVDESGTTDFAYDQFGNVVQRVHTELGVEYSHEFAYNKADNMTLMTTSAGKEISYSYDSEQRLSKLDADVNGESKTVASELVYRPDGQEIFVTFANNISEQRSYDSNGLLLSIKTEGIDPPAEDPTTDDETKEKSSSGSVSIQLLVLLMLFFALCRVRSVHLGRLLAIVPVGVIASVVWECQTLY